MNGLALWLKSLLGFLLLSSAIWELLPEGQNRKYVKLFCGMIFMLLLFQPVLQFSDFSRYLEDSWNRAAYIEEEEKVIRELEMAGEGQKEEVLAAYEDWLMEQAEALAGEYGFSLSRWDGEISTEGEVLSVSFSVSYRKEDVVSIEPVEIGTGGEDKTKTVETEKLAEEFCKRAELSEGQVEVWLEK